MVCVKSSFGSFVALCHLLWPDFDQVVPLTKLGRHVVLEEHVYRGGLSLEMSQIGTVAVHVIHQGKRLIVGGAQEGTHNGFLFRAFASHEEAQQCLDVWKDLYQKRSPFADRFKDL